jgi:nucleoid-associated protein YgaU
MRKISVFLVVVFAVLLLSAFSAAPASAAGPAPVYHVIRPGQTLSGIAAMYGVSTYAIARANGIWNPNWIYAGQMLVIPRPAPLPPAPPPPPPYYPRPTFGCYYFVHYGDSMLGIAARYHTDAWSIARANGIYNLDWIFAGQRLYIPGCR